VLAGGVAHDFNNLLTSVLGSASLARAKTPPGSQVHALLQDVERAGQRAADLATQMLAYSGKGHFVVEPLDLGVLAREVVSLLKISLPREVRVHHAIPDDLPRIEGDAAQLRQVVMSLVLNAAESMGSAGGEVVIALAARDGGALDFDAAYLPVADRSGTWLALEVTDTGSGMEPGVLARIFEPFFTTKRAGRGLGLAGVVGILRGHQGTLVVRSAPGRGTTFTVLLPSTRRPAPPPSVPPPEPAPAARRGTVLVVDDEDYVRALARAILEHAGYAVLEAGDGRDGVRALEQHRGGLAAVLLDLTMPGMDGVEAFRALRVVDPGVPILVSSGYTREDALDRLPRDARASFLQKPYRAAALLARIDEVVALAGRS
jgi:two-component system cell cycle sensor histidine kinase/response regulator CckA